MINNEMMKEINELIRELIIKNYELEIDDSNLTNIRFISKKLDKIIGQSGDGWTSSKRLLLFEFNNRKDYLDEPLSKHPDDLLFLN